MNRRSKIKYKNIIILLLIIIVIISVIFIIKPKSKVEKKLKGNKVSDGLYLYDINKESIQSINVFDDNIYYITSDNDKYSLYEINIYNNKTNKLGSVESDMCSLNSYYLSCFNNDKIQVYDMNFKEIFNGDSNTVIIPYKDLYLKVIDKDIYYNDEKYRTIKDTYSFDIINYYVYKDNTYIYFISSNNSYIYDVNKDSYDEIKYDSIYVYENGFYYGDKDKIIINNLDNKKEYDNITDDLSLSDIYDNKIIYYKDDYVLIYDLNDEKLNYIDYILDTTMDKIIVDNKYIYIIYQGDKSKVYVYDINKLSNKQITMDEFNNKQLEAISKRVKKIEDDYNVKIIYNDKDIKDNNYTFKIEDDYKTLNGHLSAIEEVYSEFGKEFISSFKTDDYKGIKLILTKEIITDDNAGLKDPVGFFYFNKEYYNISLTDNKPYEKMVCHEMMHAIEEKMYNDGIRGFANWYDYNPSDFEYKMSNYLDNRDIPNEYTIDGSNDVYFVDNYSQTNEDEDRARILEYICIPENRNNIKKYPYLLKKVKYLKNEIIKYYPVLKDSKLFNID